MEIEAEQSVDLPNSEGTPEEPQVLDQEAVVEEQTPEELEELEIDDGEKLQLPKSQAEKLRAKMLMQADYTRKTQEVAEHRKAIEAQQRQFAEAQQAFAQNAEEVAELVQVSKRLAEFGKLTLADWHAWSDRDAVAAQKAQTELMQLQARQGQLHNSLGQRRQQQAEIAQRENAKRLYEAQAVLQRDVKGWSPELANKLTEYGKQTGFPEEVLKNVTSAEFVKTLHKAYLYDQLAKQKTAPGPAQQPTPKVGAGAAKVNKSLSDMSFEEYAKARREYIKRHR